MHCAWIVGQPVVGIELWITPGTGRYRQRWLQRGAILAQAVAPAGFSLERSSVAVLSSRGNTSADNDDTTRFCRLGHVTVHRVMC